MAADKKDGKVVPGQHSPFWGPEADKVIATASEALVASTNRLMPKH